VLCAPLQGGNAGGEIRFTHHLESLRLLRQLQAAEGGAR
jgi:hypothetical protein